MNSRNVVLALAASSALTGCISIPDLRVSSVELLTTRTAVSDDAKESFDALGYLKVDFVADADLFVRAREFGSEPRFFVGTCDKRVLFGGWTKLFVDGVNSYTALVEYKDLEGSSYNLASQPEDICMYVRFIGTMNPRIYMARSNVIRFPLSDELKEELRKYDSGNGTIDIGHQHSP
jgi:hypothetical protein